MKKTGILLWILVLVSSARTQQTGLTGDFTRSPTEHIIVQISEPFIVRHIEGYTWHEDAEQPYPLGDVLFEIQGPGEDKRIRHSTSDAHGRFKIRFVPQGTYRFKTTLNGFKSVMGTIIVSRKAHDSNIQIKIPVGA